MTSPAIEYGVLRSDEADSLAGLVSQAFAAPAERVARTLSRWGVAAHRGVRRDGRLVAGLGVIDTAQWIGGDRIRAAAIRAVAVAPDARGQGIGAFLMCALLEELQASGVPLAMLYPSTPSLYRRVGFECAGTHVTWSAPLDAFRGGRRDLTVVPVEVGGHAELHGLYLARAAETSGHLDRPDVMWEWLLRPSDGRPVYAYRILRDGRPEGYVALSYPEHRQWLQLDDVCVRSPDAVARLLAFVADHRSYFERVNWIGGSTDPLALALHGEARIERAKDWMIRVVDVAGALAARRYPVSAEATLHLEVSDEVLPRNAGRVVLDVANGRGAVRQGGEGRIRLHVRGLAALFTGHVSAADLRIVDLVEASGPDLAALTALFAGPRPWMSERF